MPVRDLQSSFSGGELTPALHSRIDLAKFQSGLKTCLNFFIHASGGASNRPGFEFVGEIKDSSKTCRLIPFSFNTEQTYALEFGDLYNRVIMNGGYVLETAKVITGITQANPAVVTSTAHGFSNGDHVYIAGVAGMTEVNGKRFTVAGATANTFELSGVDSTAYTAYSSGGAAARYYTVTTTYAEAALFRLKYTQSADVMTVTHPTYPPRELSRTGHAAWTIANITFGSAISAPGGVGVATVGTASGSANKTYEYVVTAVDSNGNESVASSAVNQTVAAYSVTWGGRVSWSAATGADYYRIYKGESGAANVYGLIGESETLLFDDFNLAPDFGDSPPVNNNPFNGAGDYPGCVNYYEQRLVFGRTDNNRQTIWTTKTGLYSNMDTSRPTRSDDAITFTLAARQVNEIRHLVSLTDMIIHTSGGEWRTANGDAALTPANINVKAQGYRGSSDVPPIVIGNTILFVQDKGSIVRDLGYDFGSDSFNGTDLTILSDHLFDGLTIVDWAFSQAPYSIIWAVRSDGVLLGLTYLKEQQVWAWHRHTTDGEFESICSISEGSEDVVYVVVKRIINSVTKRYVERMHTRQFDDVQDCFFVDSGLTLDNPVVVSGATKANPIVITSTAHGFSNADLIDLSDIVGMTELNGQRYKIKNVAANTFELTDQYTDANIDGTTSSYTAYESGGKARLAVTSITGLDHLEGKTVSILANGNVEPAKVVSGGAITLTNPSSRVHVGLPYTADFETLDIDLDGRSSGKKLAVSDVIIRLLKSRGMWVGPDASNLTEFKQRGLAGEGYNEPTALLTGLTSIGTTSKWRKEGGVFIRQVDPLPVTILSVLPRVGVGGG